MNTFLLLLVFQHSAGIVYKDHVTSPITLYGYSEDQILSQNGYTQLKMQNDGNLVLYHRNDNTTSFGRHSWASYTHGYGSSCYLTLHDSGDLILYGQDDKIAWQSTDSNFQSSGSAPHDLIISDENIAYIMDSTNTVTWRSHSLPIKEYITSTDTLYGQYIDNIRSKNEMAEFRMQPDGNLVLYRLEKGTESPVWASDTQHFEQGYTAVLDDSGDLIVYNENNAQHWSSDSASGIAPFYLIVSDNVVAYIVDSTNAIVWTTNDNIPINAYPTRVFTLTPTNVPTKAPTFNPTAPTSAPTNPPTFNPTSTTFTPSMQTNIPSIPPTHVPSFHPSDIPSVRPTNVPSVHPTKVPTTKVPTVVPSTTPIATSSLNPSRSTSTTSTQTSIATSTPLTTGTNVLTTSDLNSVTTQQTDTDTTESHSTTSQTNQHMVSIAIEFEYKCSLHCDVIPFNTLYSICHNVSYDLLQYDIERIEDSCVDKIEYIMSINPHIHYVITTATIHVCNDKTLLVLSNLANIVIQQPILIDSYLTSIVETSTFSPLHSTYVGNHSRKQTDSGAFMVIVAVFGSVLTICIMIAVIACVKNGRKDHIARHPNHKDDIGEAESGKYVQYNNKNEPKAARYRIPTMSQSKPRKQSEQSNEMKALSDDDDYEDFMAADSPPEPYRMSVNRLSQLHVSAQLPLSMPKFGNGAISVESGTMSPYSSVVAREMMAEYDVDTIANLGELELMQREKVVKEWLMSTVGLAQYYTHFVSNGYESLDIIKEITDRKELKEIGIVREEDIDKLMSEIQELMCHRKNTSEGVPRMTPQPSDIEMGHCHDVQYALQTMQQIGEASQLSLK